MRTGDGATMVGFIVLMAVSSHLAPRVARRDIFFGVTVAPGFRETALARSIARRYAREIWVLACVAVALVATSPMPAISGGMLWAQCLGSLVAFAKARHALRPHAVMPATVREAEIAPRPALPGGVLGQLGPFLILIAAAAYLALHWDDVPAKFPIHWNLAGRPDGWAPKTVANAYLCLSIAFIWCSYSLARSYAVLHRARLPRVTGEAGRQDRRVREVNLHFALFFEYLVALVIAWTAPASIFSIVSAAAPRSTLPLAFRVAPFALLIGGALVIARVRQRPAAIEGPPVGDTTLDSSWILGLIYYNRADPALFVEKRLGLGYTLNFGNRWSWAIVMLTPVAIVGVLLMVP